MSDQRWNSGNSKGFTKFSRNHNIVQKLILFVDSVFPRNFFFSVIGLNRSPGSLLLCPDKTTPSQVLQSHLKPHASEDQSAAPE